MSDKGSLPKPTDPVTCSQCGQIAARGMYTYSCKCRGDAKTAPPRADVLQFIRHIERELAWLRGILSVTPEDIAQARHRLANDPALQAELARLRTEPDSDFPPLHVGGGLE